MIRPMRPFVVCVGLSVLLAAPLAGAQAADVEPIKVAPGAVQKTLRFARFRSELRDGDRIGDIRTGTPCGGPMLLTMNARTEQAVIGPVSRVVREEFMRAGYRDPIRTQQKLFEEDTDQNPSDLLLGGMLQSFQTSYCASSAGAQTEGSVRVKIRWELYDTVNREVVLTKVTEGSYQTAGAEAMREAEFFSRGYRDAVRRLLADQQFHAMAMMAPVAAEKAAAPGASAAAKVVLKPVAPIGDALAGNMTLTRAAVVTVSHAGGSGSGFFVSDAGHVITNSHVVGNNRFVRVILATGRELVGEVLHRDTGRDVALIKTEGSNFVALAVNGEDVNVGAEVTAIGSPLGEALSGTVTRGIVSAYRTIKGRRFIQSDVPILPGSSGGPLLDKSGRVVGVAVAGLGGARINFFIPIQEALGSVGITMAAQ
jgi:S1-C subfamily serine protease